MRKGAAHVEVVSLIDQTTLNTSERRRKDVFEARHILRHPSGRVVTAFERGSTALQAKKRLMRLLGERFFD